MVLISFRDAHAHPEGRKKIVQRLLYTSSRKQERKRNSLDENDHSMVRANETWGRKGAG